MNAVKSDQALHNSAFKSIAAAHQLRLKKHEEKLEEHRNKQDDLIVRLENVHTSTAKSQESLTYVHEDLAKVNRALADQQATINLHGKELCERQKAREQASKEHFDFENSRSDKLLAFVQANRLNIVQVAQAINSVREEAKRIDEAQKKNSREVEELRQFAGEYEAKFENLSNVFGGFKQNFYPKFEKTSRHLTLSAATAATNNTIVSRELMEPVD